MFLLLLGPSYTLWGLFCTTCSNFAYSKYHLTYVILYICTYIYIIWDHHLDCLDCFTNFAHCTHHINLQSCFRCPRVSCGFISPARAVTPLVLRQCNSASGCPELRCTGHGLSSGRGGMFLYFQAIEKGHCWEKCPSWNKILKIIIKKIQ